METNRLCKNCRHWQRGRDDETQRKEYGDCNSGKIVEYQGSYDDALDILYYWDYEGYQGYYSVGKNFGCVHFQGNVEHGKRRV